MGFVGGDMGGASPNSIRSKIFLVVCLFCFYNKYKENK